MKWILGLTLVATSTTAHADEPAAGFLGPAREISLSSSASRDAPAFGNIFGSRDIRTAALEIGLVSRRLRKLTLRIGFFGMLELEGEEPSDSFVPLTNSGIDFWRGHYGLSAAVSLDSLAGRWCRGCALEATISGRHESEHYTGSNDGGGGIDFSDRPHIGNFVMVDVAARRRIGRLDLVARLQDKQFVFRDGGGYHNGPGIDLHVRWRRWSRLHLFASGFAEYLLGAAGIPDNYLARAMAGVALPSQVGDIYVFTVADFGHRKGLGVFEREATLGLGVRLAFR